MLPPNVVSRRLRFAVLIADLLWILISGAVAYSMRYGPATSAFSAHPGFAEYFLVSTLTMAMWAFLFTRMKLEGFAYGWDAPRLFSQLFIGVLLLMSAMLSGAFLARQPYSRLVFFYFGILLLAGFVSIRFLTRVLITSLSRNQALSNVVILGSGRVAREIADKIKRHPELMKRVTGFLYPSTDFPTAASRPEESILPGAATSTVDVVDLLKRCKTDEIIVAHPRTSVPELQKLLHLGRSAGIKVSLVPEGYELYLSKATFLDVEGLPMLCLEERRASNFLLGIKRITDASLASILLIVASPILLPAAAALMISGTKPFRRELRCGLQGRPFQMWRLNIDRHAPDLSGFRLWLAKLSLTELPQLLNILAGSMSLVGPRPESPERVKHYSDWQRQRLAAKPGLTGFAQVQGLREQHASEDKARFDLHYMLHWSLLLDLSLLLQTCWTVSMRPWREAPAAPAVAPLNRESSFTEVFDVDRSHAGAD
jgi:lipopolysaccharide/colanic/teichoic acid biosynthesis glycosyltransferase